MYECRYAPINAPLRTSVFQDTSCCGLPRCVCPRYKPHCGTQWTTRGDGNSVIRRSSWQLVAQFSRDNSLHRLNGGTHRWISLFHSASWLLLHLENECSELVQKKCSVFLGSPQFNVIEAVDDQFRLESIHQPDCATLIVAIYLNEPQNSARNEKKCYGKILYGTKSAQGVGMRTPCQK